MGVFAPQIQKLLKRPIGSDPLLEKTYLLFQFRWMAVITEKAVMSRPLECGHRVLRGIW
jgi:hypothetical protein